MGSLVLALAIALALSAVIFGVTTAAGLKAEEARRLAELVLFFVLPIHQAFEKQRQGTRSWPLPREVLRFDRYVLPWGQMAVYGGVLHFIFGTLLAIVAALGVPTEAELTYERLVVPTSVGISVTAYFIGRWIGSRCDRRGIPALAIAAVISEALGVGLNFVFLDLDQLLAFYRPYGWAGLAGDVVLSVALKILVGLLGYWRGREARLARYLAYVLDRVPGESRNVIVRLAYDEARRVSPRQG